MTDSAALCGCGHPWYEHVAGRCDGPVQRSPVFPDGNCPCTNTPPTSAAVCPHGDPSCPCPDGDVCHYKGDPLSETLAMACWSPDCTVKEPHERA